MSLHYQPNGLRLPSHIVARILILAGYLQSKKLSYVKKLRHIWTWPPRVRQSLSLPIPKKLYTPLRDNILSQLKQWGCVLSGSYALYSLTNDSALARNHMDIFVPYAYWGQAKKYLYGHYASTIPGSSYGIGIATMHVKGVPHRNTQLQFICTPSNITDPGDVWQWIKSSFDFDFCKVAYFFESEKLYIANVPSLINKTSTFDENVYVRTLEPPLHKHTLETQSKILVILSRNAHERKEKYEKRGYTIIPRKTLKRDHNLSDAENIFILQKRKRIIQDTTTAIQIELQRLENNLQ